MAKQAFLVMQSLQAKIQTGRLGDAHIYKTPALQMRRSTGEHPSYIRSCMQKRGLRIGTEGEKGEKEEKSARDMSTRGTGHHLTDRVAYGYNDPSSCSQNGEGDMSPLSFLNFWEGFLR